MDSIAKTLGAGSGIDYSALVGSLVDAQFQAKTQRLTEKSEQLTTQLSAAGALRSTIRDFATSLKTLTKSGSLATQATSANAGVVRATAQPGAKLAGFAAQVEVRRIAQAQSSASAVIADRTAAIGTGTLTLTLGTATVANGAMTGFTPGSGTPVNITIDSSSNSLEGVARAINRARAGVTASVVNDAGGARLMLKGQTGEAQAFTLTATEDAGAPGLAALNVGVGAAGTSIGTSAQDAELVVDGLRFTRPSNSITDLVEGVRLDLVSAQPGTVVSLGNQTPSDALRQAVQNFVDTYNEVIRQVRTQTDPQTGPLRSDFAARDLQQGLGRLTQITLANAGETGVPRTLAEIGVATNRDGTLTVRTDQLDRALRDSPQAVEAMFADGVTSTNGGLAAAFDALATRANSTVGGLGASELRYTNQRQQVGRDQQRATDQAEVMRQRLTRQFSGTDARVAAYRSAQNFMQQQVDAWNGSNR
ncbi:flagellar filament capping protein FliD [Sphingomonas sp.]|uniref:flagellar filament capping protein FliD n=1 Tax=Sphingomonas sp. TaxID=28214 RepID=UPI001DFDB3A6|nr:flagellar filament capping protein FliD [Sphingomonas sp.]MBX9795344.1 flagellar filament capping protein FliD [Sphingomonas sp.]